MLPEVGHFLLILAVALSALAAILPLWGKKADNQGLIETGRPLTLLAFVAVALSIGILAVNFVQDDFSVSYVALHSNSHLPLFFKIAAVWGGHEGSFLFWLFSLMGWSAAVALCSKRYPIQFSSNLMIILALISVAIGLYIITVSNPFLRQFPVPIEGRDLNPMLQDIGLIIHPPTLYIGYVGFAVSFAFALAALLNPNPDHRWVQWSQVWTLTAWIFLTIGIALGAWWAYYELGWGGWWFWDPVENASLMPWLTGTALVHSLLMAGKRQVLMGWCILLSIMTFSLSLLGTFIVRSGVLTSVHAFAADPSRGFVLLVILGLVLIVGFGLFALRSEHYFKPFNIQASSQPFMFLLANGLWFIAMLTVLLGTLYPMLFELLDLGSISVGAPYFNTMVMPILFLLCLLMGITPFINRDQVTNNNQSLAQLLRSLAPLLLMAMVGAFGVCQVFDIDFAWFAWLGLTLALWVILTSLRAYWQAWCYLPDQTWLRQAKQCRLTGMTLAHLGLAVAMIGGTVVSYGDIEINQRMGAGDQVKVGEHVLHYRSTELIIGPNFTAEQANLELMDKNDHLVAKIAPQRRHYTVRTMKMSEPGVYWTVFSDWYITLGEKISLHDYAVRIQYKPLISWLWFGAALMMFGGISSLFGRLLVRVYKKKISFQVSQAASNLDLVSDEYVES